MPPIAAAMGSDALFRLDNSPEYISRSSSRPMSRKNTAMRPSFIQCTRLRPFSDCQNSRYSPEYAELERKSENAVQQINTMPPAFSERKKSLKNSNLPGEE